MRQKICRIFNGMFHYQYFMWLQVDNHEEEKRIAATADFIHSSAPGQGAGKRIQSTAGTDSRHTLDMDDDGRDVVIL